MESYFDKILDLCPECKPANGEEVYTVCDAVCLIANEVGNEADAELTSLRERVKVLADALDKFKWLPIESAPTNGTGVLLFDYGSIHTGWRNDKFNEGRLAGKWFDEATGEELMKPTHWMPLPAPPNEKTDEQSEESSAEAPYTQVKEEG